MKRLIIAVCDVKAARGKGDTVIGRDLLLISLPPDSKEIKQTCLN